MNVYTNIFGLQTTQNYNQILVFMNDLSDMYSLNKVLQQMRHYYMYLSRVLINVLPKKYIVGDIFYVNWGLLTVRGI